MHWSMAGEELGAGKGYLHGRGSYAVCLYPEAHSLIEHFGYASQYLQQI